MKKGLFLLGLVSCAAVATVVTYLYRTDEEVHEKVGEAAKSVGSLYDLVSDKIRKKAEAEQQEYEDEVARNQAWADQQWEALGI